MGGPEKSDALEWTNLVTKTIESSNMCRGFPAADFWKKGEEKRWT